MEQGLIHIYCGDGKGKTTAAMGLILRCVGAGGKVLCAQFLKTDHSGERKVLDKLDEVELMRCYEKVKFTFQMNEEEKGEAALFYESQLDEIIRLVNTKKYDLLVMDEIMAAVNCGFVNEEKLVSFLQNKPKGLEVVMTGRDPEQEFIDLADYVTEMIKKKHPYEQGINARKMIEW